VHVDAAYGGFFTLIADDSSDGVPSAPWLAVAEADSVVVDPHKHGLQPYGCGAVLFRDPSVGRFYQHDSPYTYFTSDELHLGEISLECSRAGAAAAALWLTLRLFPLTPDGLGAVLRPGRRAALRWSGLLADSDVLDVYQPPELDIVTYLPRADSLSALDAASGAVLNAGMEDPEDPVFLSTLYLGRADVVAERDGADEARPVDAVLLAHRQRRRHDRAAGMRLRRRMRVVGLVRMGEHAVGERGFNRSADDGAAGVRASRGLRLRYGE
jgi:hypothetical protein